MKKVTHLRSPGNSRSSKLGGKNPALLSENEMLTDLISFDLEVLEFTAIEGDPPLCPGTLTLSSARSGRKGEDRINTVGGHL